MKTNKIVPFSLFEGFGDADTNINDKDHIADCLNQLLADSFVLYTKILNFHWNIVSKKFYSLHEEFKKLYENTFDSIDLIAERIRAIGGRPLSSMKEFLEKAKIQESESRELDDKEMLKELLKDYETTIKFIRTCLEGGKIDNATNKLLEDLIEAAEKTAWMLRSNLD